MAHTPVELVESYLRALSSRDADAALGFWEADNPSIALMPEEIAEPLIGARAMRGYYEALDPALETLDVRIFSVHEQPLAETVTALMIKAAWWGRPRGARAELGGDVVIGAVARRTNDTWRLVQWTESVLGPLPFIKQVYEREGRRLAALSVG